MKMPENHPNTHHYSPYWFSNSPAGIRRARRKTPVGKVCFKDLDLQALLDDDGFIHWDTAGKEGYRFLKTWYGRRELEAWELKQSFKYWPAKKFKKLRRTKRPGLSYESRVKPMLFKKGLRVCSTYNVIPCVELKSRSYRRKQRINRLRRTAVAIWPSTMFMALYKMKYCLAKGKAVLATGGQFAILAHGEKRPIYLEKGVTHTEIWGRFS